MLKPAVPKHTFQISNLNEFKAKALQWASEYSPLACFDNNQYELDPDIYQDDSQIIKVLGHTNRWDGGTTQQKFCSRLVVIGDEATSTGNMSIAWSDDDYKTFTTDRTIDLSDNNNILTRLGSFQRRSYRYKFDANLPGRWQAFEKNVQQGHYAR